MDQAAKAALQAASAKPGATRNEIVRTGSMAAAKVQLQEKQAQQQRQTATATATAPPDATPVEPKEEPATTSAATVPTQASQPQPIAQMRWVRPAHPQLPRMRMNTPVLQQPAPPPTPTSHPLLRLPPVSSFMHTRPVPTTAAMNTVTSTVTSSATTVPAGATEEEQQPKDSTAE